MIRRLTSAVLLVWLIGFVLFVGLLPQPARTTKTDAIIVLTGGGGRIERGLQLLDQDQARRMLISGVDPTVRRPELAAQYPGSSRLFGCCIDLGREAIDTRSNAEESAAWIARGGYRSVRLVTTDWHMPRAAFELRQALPERIGLERDAVHSEPNLGVLLKEYNKYLLRRAAILFGL